MSVSEDEDALTAAEREEIKEKLEGMSPASTEVKEEFLNAVARASLTAKEKSTVMKFLKREVLNEEEKVSLFTIAEVKLLNYKKW